ncbi:hypothetical protein DFH08DRAFT_823191 [Mycena albidolilacea]|uniref:Uncharacterized protein n=1 Tax=Mycena albidolilacea TaxID=1033008 RepID=A0AAD7EBW2_9AGAR|nr:hypothetical protein DFH08DRAFT_823191 [Mycena albidolilacea]
MTCGEHAPEAPGIQRTGDTTTSTAWDRRHGGWELWQMTRSGSTEQGRWQRRDRNVGTVCVQIKEGGKGKGGHGISGAVCGGGRMRQHAGWREGGEEGTWRARRGGKEKGRVGIPRMGVWEEWIARYGVRTGGLAIKVAGEVAQAAGRRRMRQMLTRRCCTIEAHGSRSGMGEVEGEEEGVKERDEEQGMGEKAVARSGQQGLLVRALDWRTLGRTVELGSCRERTGVERRAACMRSQRMTGAASAQRCGCGESCRADHSKGAGIEQEGSPVDEAGHRRRRRGVQDAQRWRDRVQRQSAGKAQCEGGQCRVVTGKNDPYGGEIQRCSGRRWGDEVGMGCDRHGVEGAGSVYLAGRGGGGTVVTWRVRRGSAGVAWACVAL